MTVYPSQFASQWSEVALVGIILAMALGGSACSTAGGIKALRVGMFFKTLKLEVKKHLLPSSAVVVEKYHHIKEEILKGEVAQSAFFIILLYLLSYFLGGVVGSLLGYPFFYALFESVSATANVGLSVGITSPSMPSLLKVVYILQMWIGRLEFISVLSLFGLIYALWRGK
jgi:trk system potassium uptake protein TrkH